MPWEVLIIPLIALGVWILGTIFRGVEDERQKALLRPVDEGGGVRVPVRRPVTDLDRFLEEARRRREAGQGAASPPRPEPPPAPRPQPLPALPAEPPRPRAEAPRPAERRTRPREARPATRRADAPLPAIPVVKPSPAPAEPARVDTAPVVLAPPPTPATQAGAPAALPSLPQLARLAPIPGGERPLSPALAQVNALLRDPRSLAAAMVLREVLDRPVGLRRRR